MKMSKKERKAYNQGKATGFMEGYSQGLHDGNPFIIIAEAAERTVKSISEHLSDPEFIKALEEARQAQLNQEQMCLTCKWADGSYCNNPNGTCEDYTFSYWERYNEDT